MLFLLLSLTLTCSLSWSRQLAAFVIPSATGQLDTALPGVAAAGVDTPQKLYISQLEPG